ncbi:MAG: winged helix-turn-helix domain-containing protein [Leptospirillum sp.]
MFVRPDPTRWADCRVPSLRQSAPVWIRSSKSAKHGHSGQVASDALSQETHLKVFRILVDHGTEGAPAGILSEKLGIPPNTLSFHLSNMRESALNPENLAFADC